MKLNSKGIILVFFMSLLLLNLAIGIEPLAETEEYALLSADEYVFRFPLSQDRPDLSESVTLNNRYSLNLIPSITVGGRSHTISPGELERNFFSRPRDTYSFSFSGEAPTAIMEQEIDFKEDNVVLRTLVTNIAQEEQKINVWYDLEGEERLGIFIASEVDEEKDRYAVVSKKDHLGLSLGVTSTHPIVGEEAFMDRMVFSVMGSETVQPGKTMEMRVIITPINVQLSNTPYEFSSEYLGHMENPLVNAEGQINMVPVEGSLSNKVQSILDHLTQEKELTREEFEFIEDSDISKTSLNSLEASLAFKELCKIQGVPCRLVIGEEATFYYSWIRALEEDGWVDVDPSRGVKSAPLIYDEIYSEPLPMYTEVSGTYITPETYLEATSFLNDVGRPRPLGLLLLILALVVVLTALGYFVLTIEISKSSPETLTTEEVSLEGEYIVNSDKSDVEDPSALPVFEKVVDEGGVVDVSKYSEETGYSEEFIKDSLRYLKEQGCIELKDSAINKEFMRLERELKKDEEKKTPLSILKEKLSLLLKRK